MIDLWLDDMRLPPEGWVWVKTVEHAKDLLRDGEVRRASLDHNLGACGECYDGTAEQWLEEHGYKSMPHCPHVGTGYDLVCWMKEMGTWPKEKPVVHSANPDGRRNMLEVIDHSFPAEE
jgi:hypothetical protein